MTQMILMATLVTATTTIEAAPPAWYAGTAQQLEAELATRHGEAQRPRLQRGLRQVGDFWRDGDGGAAVFAEFVRKNFAGDAATLDALFGRFQDNLEQLDGHLNEMRREFREQVDLDVGAILPFDEVFAGFEPGAHMSDDFFDNKLAFVVLLNFPITTLQQRLAEGANWSRRQWAETRLAERYARRIPAAVTQAIAKAAADSDRYIAEYNIWMHHLVEFTPRSERLLRGDPEDAGGARLFPPKLKLLSHWNLRDEIKAQYSSGDAQGLARQRMVQKVMERIVAQEIPAVVVNNPAVDWDPFANQVKPAAVMDAEGLQPAATADAAREPDTRYAMLLADFRATRLADPYSPTAPTLIARRFDEDRQIPEPRVRQMLEAVLSAPEAAQVARLVAARLGRPLEPFDIWYNGFRPRGTNTEARLDGIVRKRYPDAAAYHKDMPRLLRKLGFAPTRAQYLADSIVVDPARGSGHAAGAAMRAEKAHLRTRIGKDGMDYKGFNIAVHEMGHNVEQTFSLRNVDHWLLNGVPNTAFTEALAFVFQNRDLELLDLARPDPRSHALKTLNDFWGTFEIAGVALVDMGVWHWLYDHPEATPAQLRDATLTIARDTWNRYFAPLFGARDVTLLAVYSHMIHSFLYLPDYPLGHLIAFQIEAQMDKAGKSSAGKEFERMASYGRVTPDQWMIHATGKPVGPDALLEETRKALALLGAP